MKAPTNFPAGGEAQDPSIPGPDVGIIEVPYKEPQYPCKNDCETYGGICNSKDKVFIQGEKCMWCEVNGFPVSYSLF